MAVGYTGAFADASINALVNNTSFAVTTAYVKLHIGDPGAAGAGNPAVETTRQSASFGTSASGVVASDADVTWSAVSTTEVYSHFSLWDLATGGTCYWTGTISGGSVQAGNDFVISSGDIDLTMTIAS